LGVTAFYIGIFRADARYFAAGETIAKRNVLFYLYLVRNKNYQNLLREAEIKYDYESTTNPGYLLFLDPRNTAYRPF